MCDRVGGLYALFIGHYGTFTARYISIAMPTSRENSSFIFGLISSSPSTDIDLFIGIDHARDLCTAKCRAKCNA